MISGESVVEAGGVSVVIPKAVANALGLDPGDHVDVDFFDGTNDYEENYGADRAFIAITTQS